MRSFYIERIYPTILFNILKLGSSCYIPRAFIWLNIAFKMRVLQSSTKH